MIRSDSDELLNRILNEQLASDHHHFYKRLIPEDVVEAENPSSQSKDNTLLSHSYSTSSSLSSSSLPSLASVTSADSNHHSHQPPRQSIFQRIFFIMHLVFAFFVVLWFITVFLVKSSFHTPNESTYKLTAKLFDEPSRSSSSDIEVDYSDQYGLNYGEFLLGSCGADSSNRRIVIDSHDGNLTDINASMNANQFTFVYLYANWCARSMHYRRLIERLACEHPEISFIAVNCFSSKGECRKTFNLLRYPQIIVHTRDIGFLVYKGPFEYAYLTQYLSLVKKPLERIDNFEEFIDFVLLNDRVVFGHFNFTNKSDASLFKTFYLASLKCLNLDSENPIRFGVVINRNLWRRINKFGLKPSSKPHTRKIVSFSTYGLEKGLKSFKGNSNADYLVNWAYRHLRPTISWYYPDRVQTKRSDINEFLVFYPRNFTNADNKLKNIQLTMKMLLLESYYNLYHFGPSLFYSLLKESYLGRKSCKQLDPVSVLTNGDLFVDRMWCDRNAELRSNERFFLETSLALIDSNLYSNYASSLLRTTDVSSFPFSLLIDHRNESLLLFDDEFNFANMKKFIKNQEYGLNKRYLKSSQNSTRTKQQRDSSVSIENVDSKRLLAIFGQDFKDSISLYHNKDLLLFYYNNWCGFCNIVNHKLIVLSQKYFKNVDTFKILKIDVSTNDLPWYIQVSRVPSLLFIPSNIIVVGHSSHISSRRDSIPYDLTSSNSSLLDEKHLARFVLENARNPATLSSFLRENFFLNRNSHRSPPLLVNNNINNTNDFDLSKSSKLRYDFINLVARKEKSLRVEIGSLEHGDYFNQTISNQDDLVAADFYLKLKLNRLFFELDVLKNFTSLFNN